MHLEINVGCFHHSNFIISILRELTSPASSAILACSALTTSMIKPPRRQSNNFICASLDQINLSNLIVYHRRRQFTSGGSEREQIFPNFRSRNSSLFVPNTPQRLASYFWRYLASSNPSATHLTASLSLYSSEATLRTHVETLCRIGIALQL